MENQLEKRYGLLTAVCVVIGIVVGSGVFFKAEKILVCTDGRTGLAYRRNNHGFLRIRIWRSGIKTRKM